MALLSDRAKLIAELLLVDKLSGPSKTATSSLGKLDSATSRVGKSMGVMGHTISTALGVGLERAVSAGFGFVKSSIEEGIAGAQKLEDVMTATNTVLKSTKGASGQTSAGIRQMASDFEDMNSLIDDKVIQSAENMVATFTGIGPKAFKPATQAILDMNTAMGGGEAGLQSVAIQVGKALQDPIKGATALRRVGVALTEQQQKQIKTLIGQNDLYGAQQIILKELGTEFGGRFAAQGKTGAAQMAAFADSVDDLKISMAQGLLPGLGNVAKALSTTFRDPAMVAGVNDFGKKISAFLTPANIQAGIGMIKGAFQGIVGFAKAVPWGAIGDALRIGGMGARAILDAFGAMPSWMQTVAVGIFAGNKLSGGAITGLVGSLATGLIKGVLGINAGVVNINAAAVTGGVPGVGGGAAAAGGKSLLGLGAKFILGPAAAVVIGAEIGKALNANTINPAKQAEQGAVAQSIVSNSDNLGGLQKTLDAIDSQLNTSDTSAQVALIASRIPFIGDALGNVATELEKQRADVVAAIDAQKAKILQSNMEEGRKSAGQRAQAAAAMARLGVTSLAGNRTAQQIRDAVTRQNPELASIASSSAVTSRKNFSPTFNATVNIDQQISHQPHLAPHPAPADQHRQGPAGRSHLLMGLRSYIRQGTSGVDAELTDIMPAFDRDTSLIAARRALLQRRGQQRRHGGARYHGRHLHHHRGPGARHREPADRDRGHHRLRLLAAPGS